MANNILEEDEQIPLDKVKLNREWSVWENYDLKPGEPKVEYSELVKDLHLSDYNRFLAILEYISWSYPRKYFL